jgi:RNA polymerase sigma-70 factor (ECF subfamily)
MRTLMRVISRGNKRAMQVLFARHGVRTFRYVLRLVPDATMAEDLVSDILLDVWRQADKFQGHFQASTWILAIAHNNS